jgi:hypothetical protein
MHWIARLAACALILTACGGAPAVTVQLVTDKLTALGARNIREETFPPETPIPRSFIAHRAFEIPSVAPKGGQFFLCDTKRNCDAIYAYFDAFKALGGSYLYQSPGGTVVVQLNSGLMPAEAATYEAAVKALP